MMRRILGLLMTTALLVAAGSAEGQVPEAWTIDYTQSSLGFTATEGGSAFNGTFSKWQADVNFDPQHPEYGKITAVIDMSSATTGSDDRDNALPGSDWFAVGQFPRAQFATTHITPAPCKNTTTAAMTDVRCYHADGILTIKGMARPVTMDFWLGQQGAYTMVKGDVKLLRLDFSVGQGQWSTETYVKNAVDVTINIVAQPVAGQ